MLQPRKGNEKQSAVASNETKMVTAKLETASNTGGSEGALALVRIDHNSNSNSRNAPMIVSIDPNLYPSLRMLLYFKPNNVQELGSLSTGPRHRRLVHSGRTGGSVHHTIIASREGPGRCVPSRGTGDLLLASRV